MRHTICTLLLIILAYQISVIHSEDSMSFENDLQYKRNVSAKNSDDSMSVEIDLEGKKSIKEWLNSKIQDENNFECNPHWLRDHPNRDEIIKNYKAWSSCTISHREESECAPLFETLGKRGQSIIQKVMSYILYALVAADDYNKCLKSDRHEDNCHFEKADWERILTIIKYKGFPWSELYELCISANTKRCCMGYLEALDLLVNPVMEFEDMARMLIFFYCVNSEKSGEKCVEELNIEFAFEEEGSEFEDTHKRDANEL